MVPDNPVKAAANGDMLAVIVFSLLFGLALAVTRTPAVDDAARPRSRGSTTSP